MLLQIQLETSKYFTDDKTWWFCDLVRMVQKSDIVWSYKKYILPYYRQRLIVDYNYALCVILEYSRLGSVYDFDQVILVFQSKIELWECFNRHYWECGNKNCTHQLQISITIHKNTLHNDNFLADFRPHRGYRVSRLHVGDDIACINMSQEGCLGLSDVDLKTQAKVLHREKHYNNMYDLIYKYK